MGANADATGPVSRLFENAALRQVLNMVIANDRRVVRDVRDRVNIPGGTGCQGWLGRMRGRAVSVQGAMGAHRSYHPPLPGQLPY